jgi:DNA polymerase-3 subunit delta
MIIRQFRLILQAREILDGGGSERDVAAQLHTQYFVANKVSAQSMKFDLQALEAIYQQLLEIDIGEKTGGMPGEIAVDLLIARLTHSMV